jgi:hypothetical protein
MQRLELDEQSGRPFNSEAAFRLSDMELKRRPNPGFWLATLSSVRVQGLIAFERLHKTSSLTDLERLAAQFWEETGIVTYIV